MKKGITKSKNMIMLITIGVIVLAIGLIALVGSMNSKGKDAAPSVEVVSVGTETSHRKWMLQEMWKANRRKLSTLRSTEPFRP